MDFKLFKGWKWTGVSKEVWKGLDKLQSGEGSRGRKEKVGFDANRSYFKAICVPIIYPSIATFN